MWTFTLGGNLLNFPLSWEISATLAVSVSRRGYRKKMNLLKISRLPDFIQCLPDLSQRFPDFSLKFFSRFASANASLNPRLVSVIMVVRCMQFFLNVHQKYWISSTYIYNEWTVSWGVSNAALGRSVIIYLYKVNQNVFVLVSLCINPPSYKRSL